MTKTESSESTDTEEAELHFKNQKKMDQIEWLAIAFWNGIKTPWLSIKRLSSYLMIERGGYMYFDSAAQWSIHHPLYSLLICVAFLFSLPLLILVGVVVSIAAITFTGFIVIEGTLLTFVSVLSFGCLGALLIVLTSFVVITVAVYMGFAHIYDLYGSGKGKAALEKFLNIEHKNQNGTSPHVDSIGSDVQ